MFVEHHSPRADRILSADVSMRENTRLFSPKSLSPSLQRQSPKRKSSDDIEHLKRTRSNEIKALKHDNDLRTCHGDDWPVFIHPDGGYIQQSPYGIIHIIKDENSERSSIDNTITLETFARKVPEPKPIPTTPKQTKSKVSISYSRLPLPYSPSSEIENYMAEGYEREHNQSYDHHKDDIVNVNYNLYDHHTEDLHLETEQHEDYDMTL